MISIGIDIGSVAAKAAAFNGEEIIARTLAPTGWSPQEVGRKLLDEIFEQTGFTHAQVKSIIGTGYGRVSLPFIDRAVTEITCHGRGAFYLDPQVRTVIDIGGQDSKVIKLNDQGQVMDFLMNDKCAAGTGRFLQVMANTLAVDVGDLSDLAAQGQPANISSMCTVFAESEVVSLVAAGSPKEDIAAGLLHSVCNKTYALISRIGVEDKVFFSGGVSRNSLMGQLLSEKLDVEVLSSHDSPFLGAIGAAILGW